MYWRLAHLAKMSEMILNWRKNNKCRLFERAESTNRTNEHKFIVIDDCFNHSKSDNSNIWFKTLKYTNPTHAMPHDNWQRFILWIRRKNCAELLAHQNSNDEQFYVIRSHFFVLNICRVFISLHFLAKLYSYIQFYFYSTWPVQCKR